ncbi:MAG: zinc-binding dehydrogenase [Alphaproteobacteria bacterium]|nr:zinc-binding dehydrogenase [Alphaproteobacteria bacterium]
MAEGERGLQLRSLITKSGRLELSLPEVPTPQPGTDEVVVRVEATPINPSDLGLLLGPADPAALTASGTADAPRLCAHVPEARMAAMAGRIDQSLPVGNEGAGVVIRTGTSPAAKELLGRTVAMVGGAMYAQYRTLSVGNCLPLPEGSSAVEGASCFINPLTALGMVETMRREGHTALVHTAAASNLGQILNRICLKDGIALVNIVRGQAQLDLLRGSGARHVIDSTAPSFIQDLNAAMKATSATIGFDAIGGGRLASQILSAMELAANTSETSYSRYGSSVHKQVYIYGGLDSGAVELVRNFGMAWGVGGWLLFPFLAKIGKADAARLRSRVIDELKTTFVSRYSRRISLRAALDPANVAVYARRATGQKFLICPHSDA